MRIAVITNSRIPSLTANSIQAMKVCDALTQLGHELQILAPAEAAQVSPEVLAGHYGLRARLVISRLPSLRAFKRFDFIWYAHWAAQKFEPDLIYTWLPQSAVLALRRNYPVVLEMHADVAGHLGAWWLRQFWRHVGASACSSLHKRSEWFSSDRPALHFRRAMSVSRPTVLTWTVMPDCLILLRRDAISICRIAQRRVSRAISTAAAA